MGGLLSNDCTVSPLCNHNKVWLAYTDGNSFSGAAAAPVPVPNSTDLLWFRGRANIDAVLDAVARNVHGAKVNMWKDARHVVETGCSAGGLATYLHANYLADKLAGQFSGVFLAMPISGYFLNHPNPFGEYVYGDQIAVIHALSNASIDTACEAAYTPTGDTWRCNMAQYIYPFIKVPLFVLNSFYDSWQTGCVMTAEPVVSNPSSNGNCSAAPGYGACARNPATACSATQVEDVVVPFGQYMTTSLVTVNAAKSQAPGSGGFLTSCHTHCEAQGSDLNVFSVNGLTMGAAARAWIAANTATPGTLAPPMWTIDCELPVATTPHRCNPTCGGNAARTYAGFALE